MNENIGSKASDYFKKYVIMFYGVCIQTFGIGLSYYSEMGSGPIAVFNQGMNRSFGISVGTASWIMSVFFIILAFIIKSKFLSIATIIMTVSFGYMLDFWTTTIGYFFPEVVSLNLQLVTMVVSTVVTAVGMGIIISAGAGAGATESFMLMVTYKTGFPFKYMVMLVNGIFGVIGWCLGGTVGAATVAMMIFCGPIASVVTQISSRTLVKALGVRGLSVN